MKLVREESVRRGDEESLYYILERDLDRGALFPANDGWLPQVKTTEDHNYRIDYVLQYGDKLVGLEVKYDFPRLWDFEQVKGQYAQSLNAVFLAYPSDRVGEAISFVEGNKDYRSYGLLSVALFRSHCIRKARLRESRYNNYIWKSHFDKERIVSSLPDNAFYNVPKKDRSRIVIELSRGTGRSILKKQDWQMLALVLSLFDVYGYNKYMAWEGGDGIARVYLKVFKSYPYYPESLVYSGLICENAYGSRLTMLAPTDGAIYYRQKIEQLLSQKHRVVIEKIKTFRSEWEQHRRQKQKEGKSMFLQT